MQRKGESMHTKQCYIYKTFGPIANVYTSYTKQTPIWHLNSHFFCHSVVQLDGKANRTFFRGLD